MSRKLVRLNRQIKRAVSIAVGYDPTKPGGAAAVQEVVLFLLPATATQPPRLGVRHKKQRHILTAPLSRVLQLALGFELGTQLELLPPPPAPQPENEG